MSWWPWRKAHQPAKEEPEADHTLSDIIRGIAHAAAAADEIQDRHFMKHLNRYFTQEADGSFTAKYARIRMPGDTHYVDVPLISLMDPGTLHLGEMEVRMGVRMSKTEVKQAVDQAGRSLGVSRSSFHVEFTGAKPGERQDVMDITMKFKRPENNLEGVTRVIEDLNQTITPKPLTPETEPPKHFSDVYTKTHQKAPDGADDETVVIEDDSGAYPQHPEGAGDAPLE